MATEITTQVEINAKPSAVWAELMAFESYPSWNPFIKRIEGKPVPGEKLLVVLHPPGGNAMTFKPKVLVATKDVEFKWLGHLLVPGIFDGEHRFELRETANGCTLLVHAERFHGLLVPLLRKMLNTKTKAGFEQMNAALKMRAEAAKG